MVTKDQREYMTLLTSLVHRSLEFVVHLEQSGDRLGVVQTSHGQRLYQAAVNFQNRIGPPPSRTIDVTINGETFEISPPGISEMDAVRELLRSRVPNYVKMAAEAFADAPEEIRRQEIDRAYDRLAGEQAAISCEQIEDFSNTNEGQIYILYLCLCRAGYGERFTFDSLATTIQFDVTDQEWQEIVNRIGNP